MKKALTISRKGLIQLLKFWWASRESNTVPTDYESILLNDYMQL